MAVILEMVIKRTYLLNMINFFLTKQPIDCLTDNIVERLMFSSIKGLFDNGMYEINPPNTSFYELNFDHWMKHISRKKNIVEGFNNGLIVDIHKIEYRENKTSVQCIDLLTIKKCMWSQ